MNNFMVRFLYEAFFELVLCALINISTSSSGAPGGTGTWLLSLLVLISAIAAIAFIFTMYFKNGPYVSGTYETGSVLASFLWGVRPLDPQMLQSALSLDEKPIGKL